MKTNKFILVCLLALVALLAFSTKSNAQAYSSVTLSVPATLAAGTTNLASAPLIGPLKQQNLAIAATVSGTAATTNIYTFNRSVDGVNWDTNAVNNVTLGAYAAGATPVTTTTNFNTVGYGYYRLVSIQIVSSGTATNNSFSYGLKQLSP